MKLASIQRGSSKCPSTVTQTVFFQALTQTRSTHVVTPRSHSVWSRAQDYRVFLSV